MSTTALRRYAELKLELLETERAMELKSAIMQDEVTGVARWGNVFDEEDKKFYWQPKADGQLTELWWAMLAGKNRLESHRAALIWELNQLEPQVQDDKVFLVILAVANGYGISFGELIGKTRKQHITEGRAVCWALLTNHTKETIADISRIFSCDHSSVSNQYRTAIEWLFDAKDNRVIKNYNAVKPQLQRLLPDIDVDMELKPRYEPKNQLKEAS